MKFLAEAFKRGVLNGRTTWRKFYRWTILTVLWLLAAASVAFGIWSPTAGTLYGAASIIWGMIFLIYSVTAIFMFATTEYYDED